MVNKFNNKNIYNKNGLFIINLSLYCVLFYLFYFPAPSIEKINKKK